MASDTQTASTTALRVVERAGGAVLGAHHHDRPRLCLVLDGGFEEVIAGASARHGRGVLLFRPAQVEHSEVFDRTGARYGVIPLGAEFQTSAEGLGVDLQRPATLPLTGFARLAAELLCEDVCRDSFTTLSCEALASEALGLMARTSGAGPHASPRPLAERAMEVLADRLGEPMGLAALARLVEAHPAHLARAFRQAHGESVGAALRRLRTRQAARLLRGARLSIAEIAGLCGFASQAHMTTTFVALTGVTPARYRRDAR